MSFFIPDVIKNMDRGDLASKLCIDWMQAERLQKGVELPTIFFTASPAILSERLGISEEEVNWMVHGKPRKE